MAKLHQLDISKCNPTTSHAGTIGSLHRELWWTQSFFNKDRQQMQCILQFLKPFLTSVILRCAKRENIQSKKGRLGGTNVSCQKWAKSLLDRNCLSKLHNRNSVETRGTTIPTAMPAELAFFWLVYILSQYIYIGAGIVSNFHQQV